MTRPYAVTTEPGDLAAALGLRPGAPCTLEVVAGNAPACMFTGGASAPLDRSYYHAIEPGAAGRFDFMSFGPIWVWAGQPSRLVVTTRRGR